MNQLVAPLRPSLLAFCALGLLGLGGCGSDSDDVAPGSGGGSGAETSAGGTGAGSAAGSGSATGSGGASPSGWGCTAPTSTCECYDDDELPVGYESPTCTATFPCCVTFDVSNDNGQFHGCVCYDDAWLTEHGTTCTGQRDSIEAVDMYTNSTVTSACPP